MGCGSCRNQFWYNEHIHGDEMHSLYDNVQNHGGEWFPYNCGIDRRLCGGVDLALTDGATAIDGMMQSTDWTAHDFGRLMEALAEDGIQATVSDLGLELAARCGMSNADDVLTRTVVLSEPQRQRVRNAMNAPAQG